MEYCLRLKQACFSQKLSPGVPYQVCKSISKIWLFRWIWPYLQAIWAYFLGNLSKIICWNSWKSILKSFKRHFATFLTKENRQSKKHCIIRPYRPGDFVWKSGFGDRSLDPFRDHSHTFKFDLTCIFRTNEHPNLTPRPDKECFEVSGLWKLGRTLAVVNVECERTGWQTLVEDQ